MSPTYIYTAKTSAGANVEGRIEAPDRGSVVGQLRSQDLYVTDIKEERERERRNGRIAFPTIGGVGAKDLAVFSRQMTTMLLSGMTITAALRLYETQTAKASLKTALREMRVDVETGSSLSDAVRRHPKVFPSLFAHMIEAGESSGTLDVVFRRLAEHYEKEHVLKQKIVSALIYPSVIVLFASGVLVVVLLYVLPQFAALFKGLGAELPRTTQFLISFSNALGTNALLTLGIISTATAALLAFVHTKRGKYWVDKILLGVPIIGPIITKVAAERFCRTLATLLAAGISLLKAIEIVRNVVGNTAVSEAIVVAESAIRQGGNISGALEGTGVFPAIMTQMISVGENTGSLEGVLQVTSDYFGAEVDRATQNLAALIEPAMIGILGIAIGFAIISILGPLFDMIGMVG